VRFPSVAFLKSHVVWFRHDRQLWETHRPAQHPLPDSLSLCSGAPVGGAPTPVSGTASDFASKLMGGGTTCARRTESSSLDPFCEDKKPTSESRTDWSLWRLTSATCAWAPALPVGAPSDTCPRTAANVSHCCEDHPHAFLLPGIGASARRAPDDRNVVCPQCRHALQCAVHNWEGLLRHRVFPHLLHPRKRFLCPPVRDVLQGQQLAASCVPQCYVVLQAGKCAPT